MAKKPTRAAAPPPDKAAESRYFWSGVIFGAMTLLGLGALLWMSTNGKSIAEGDRYIAIFFLALGAGLSVGALGGSASAGGQMKFGWFDTPLKVAFTGGICVFLIVLFAAPQLLPESAPAPALSLNDADGVVLDRAPKPDRVLVTTKFTAFAPQANRRVVLNLGAGSGDTCDRIKSSQTVDEPRLGQYRSFVLATPAEITCAQLALHDQNNTRVGASKVLAVKW